MMINDLWPVMHSFDKKKKKFKRKKFFGDFCFDLDFDLFPFPDFDFLRSGSGIQKLDEKISPSSSNSDIYLPRLLGHHNLVREVFISLSKGYTTFSHQGERRNYTGGVSVLLFFNINMTSFVRESKYRHVVCALAPKEQAYEQLRIANVQSDGNMVSCNSQFLAYTDSAAGGEFECTFLKLQLLLLQLSS